MRLVLALLLSSGACAWSLPAPARTRLQNRGVAPMKLRSGRVRGPAPARADYLSAIDTSPAAAVPYGGSDKAPGPTLVLLAAVVMLLVSTHRTVFSVSVVKMQQELGLSSATVGLLQSAYLVGYALTNGAGGALADKVGGAPVMLGGLLIWSVCVAGMPLAAASPNPIFWLVTLRVLFGLASGPALPGSLAVVSAWLPPALRSGGIANIFFAFNAGSAVGLLAGSLVNSLGWRTLSVLAGAAGAAWASGGLLVNKAVTKNAVKPAAVEEKATKGAAKAAGSKWAVAGQIAALTHVHNAINWSFFFMQAWLPTYFAQDLGLELSKSASLAALPFVTMALGSKVSGSIATGLIQKGWKAFDVRRLMIAISSAVPAVALLVLSYLKTPAPAVLALVVALGAHSFSSAGYHAHLSDVAPEASGKIIGFTNTVGIVVGIIANVVTARVLDATGSFQACFFLTSAIYVSELLAFFAFVKPGKLAV